MPKERRGRKKKKQNKEVQREKVGLYDLESFHSEFPIEIL
jgi:hypothetical protein